jgi:hypothetical protein
MTALLAGAGVTCLWAAAGIRRRVAAALLLALATFEHAPHPPWALARRAAHTAPIGWNRVAGPGALRALICVLYPLSWSDYWGPSRAARPAKVAMLARRPFETADDVGASRGSGQLGAMGYSHVVVSAGDNTMGAWSLGHTRRERGLAPRTGIRGHSILR